MEQPRILKRVEPDQIGKISQKGRHVGRRVEHRFRVAYDLRVDVDPEDRSLVFPEFRRVEFDLSPTKLLPPFARAGHVFANIVGNPPVPALSSKSLRTAVVVFVASEEADQNRAGSILYVLVRSLEHTLLPNCALRLAPGTAPPSRRKAHE